MTKFKFNWIFLVNVLFGVSFFFLVCGGNNFEFSIKLTLVHKTLKYSTYKIQEYYIFAFSYKGFYLLVVCKAVLYKKILVQG